MTQRDYIEKIKRAFEKSLEKNSPQYRAAIVRELDFLFRKHGNDNIDIFITVIEKKFNIPAGAKAEIINDFKKAQKEIAELWKDYFNEQLPMNNEQLKANDYEQLRALYQIDFKKIKKETQGILLKETIRIARSGKGFTELRSRLKKRGLGEGEAKTLANTSLAQFDNAMMFEFAAQGGIEKFKYDGVLHENSRDFCKLHLGETFTIAEILKMDNGQGLPVKTSCGGYNCTHFWTPVINE